MSKLPTSLAEGSESPPSPCGRGLGGGGSKVQIMTVDSIYRMQVFQLFNYENAEDNQTSICS